MTNLRFNLLLKAINYDFGLEEESKTKTGFGQISTIKVIDAE